MLFWSIVIAGAALIILVLRWYFRLLSRPAVDVVVKPNKEVRVSIKPDNLDPATLIIFLVAYAANFRTCLKDKFPDVPDITNTFDEVMTLVLSDWNKVQEGTIFETEYVRQLWGDNTSYNAAVFHASLTETLAEPHVAIVLSRSRGSSGALYQFLAFLIATAQALTTPYSQVLELALKEFHSNRQVMPTGSLDWPAREKLSQYSRSCYESALKATGVVAPAASSDKPTIRLRMVVPRILLFLGSMVRRLSFLVYVVLWLYGIRDPLTFMLLGVSLHAGLVMAGGICGVLGTGIFGRATVSRWAATGRILSRDGVLVKLSSVIVGGFYVLANRMSPQGTRYSLWETFCVFLIATGLWYMLGEILTAIGMVLTARGFQNVWSPTPAVPLKQSVRINKKRFPRLPIINFFISFSYIHYFTVFMVLNLIIVSLSVLVFAPRKSIVWGLVISVLCSINITVATRLARVLIRFTKSSLKILVLRRFSDVGSKKVRKQVIPFFGAYGSIITVNDAFYNVPRESLGYDTDIAESLLDDLSDYESRVAYSDSEWQSKVRQHIKESDLCVIDASDIGRGVAWEIKTALSELPPAQIILVARYQAALTTEDNLFENISKGVITDLSPEEAETLIANLKSLNSPMLYAGSFASVIFRFRIYLLFKRLRRTALKR